MTQSNQLIELLTSKQRQVARLLVDESLADREIADRLGLAEGTVKQHLRFMKIKLGVVGGSRVELASLLREDCTERAPHAQRFTPRERVTLNRLAEGATNRAIAREVGTSEQVVKNICRELYNKTGTYSRLELSAWFAAHQLTGDNLPCTQ